MRESALVRGIHIIDAIAARDGHMRYTEIRESILNGLNPRSTSRLLHDLCQVGVLKKNADNAYELTHKIFLWSRAMSEGDNLADITRPWLKRISEQYGITSALFVRIGDHMMCLSRVTAPSGTSLIPVGECRPLNIIRSGGIFYMPSEALNDITDLYEQVLDQIADDPNADPTPDAIRIIIENYRKEEIMDDEGGIYPGCRRLAVPLQDNGRVIGVLTTGATTDLYLQSGFRDALLADLKIAAGHIVQEAREFY